MNDTKKPRQKLKSLQFENRAWEKAEHPRLVSNQIQCKDEVIVFEIGFHHGRKRWYLETFVGKNGSKAMKFFSDVLAIQEYIETEYNCKPKIPKEFLSSNKS